MSEHDEQAALFQWARSSTGRYPELAWMFAVPNGTRTTPHIASRMKAEGVLKGVSDIFLPCARGGYHGLFIEMKALKGSASPEQKTFIEAVRSLGYKALVCKGWERAKDEIEKYLEGL